MRLRGGAYKVSKSLAIRNYYRRKFTDKGSRNNMGLVVITILNWKIPKPYSNGKNSE